MSRTMNRTTRLMVSVLLLAGLCTVAVGKVIYVDDDAFTITHTGSSWALAYNHLQDALASAGGHLTADANSSEGPVEIRVAQGVYMPDQGIGIESGDRDASFRLLNGVVLQGGYAGFGEPNADARDIELYETILSGDLIGNDIEVSNPCDLLGEPTRAENSYTVVMVADDNCYLDGFTISGGNANEPIESIGGSSEHMERSMGGGMYIDMSSVTITNCIFRDNSVSCDGGGIFGFSGEGPTLDNCVFIRNFSREGGGMYNLRNNPMLTNCRFTANSSMHGAGMLNYESRPVLTNCIFCGNRAFIFRRSELFGFGGGIFYREGCQAIMTNCTFAQNSSVDGNAIAFDSVLFVSQGIVVTSSSNIELINCILHDGGNEICNNNDSTIDISYSNIQGGWSGEGGYNIDADPMFANPGYWIDANDPNIIVEPDEPNAVWINGDYHLKSQAGRFDPDSGSWVIDDVTSPCIDAGDPNSPVGDEPEPSGGRTNMGAYGGTTESSKSPAD